MEETRTPYERKHIGESNTLGVCGNQSVRVHQNLPHIITKQLELLRADVLVTMKLVICTCVRGFVYYTFSCIGEQPPKYR